MLSQTAEYALRVAVHLASLGGKPATTREIAAATRVPVGYLSKVLQGLSRGGIVSSQRGLHGGSVLTRPPEALSVYDVIQAIDPIRRIRSCPLGLKGHGKNLCPLHKRLDEAMESVEKAFQDSTLADLLSEPTTSTPLCDTADTGARQKRDRPVQLTVARRR
jgi:Rrf2 family transcriptional regulator, nitric oxide-sensitive transcriptional repressor